MIKKIGLSAVILSLICFNVNAGQCSTTDSTWLKLEIDLRGRWQQGTLSQIGIHPGLRLQFGNSRYQVDLRSNYQLLKAKDLVLIDDLWTQGKLIIAKERAIYPIVATNIGYALSYRIDHSLLIGVGIGSDFWRQRKRTSLQINLFVGHLNFNFLGEVASNSAAIGSQIECIVSLGKTASISGQVHSYHPLGEHNFWGVNSAIQIIYPISKQFSLQTNYQYIFNNQTVMGIKKVNTILQFGFRYQLFTSQ